MPTHAVRFVFHRRLCGGCARRRLRHRRRAGQGIRQMTRLGFHVVLVRDLTDTMYDPRTRPFVSHARGTELVIEHIETMWCPSILGEDLTRVVPGSDDPPAGRS